MAHKRDEMYLYSSDPHTAVPDWIALRDDISYGARNFAHRLIIWKTGSVLPPRLELARRMGVDPRTIAGWMDELRLKGAISTRTIGKRICLRFTPEFGIKSRNAPLNALSDIVHEPCIESSPPVAKKHTIADLKTETGRWMLRTGFSLTKAVLLQQLDLAACEHDFARRRAMGQRHGAIVQAWETEAPTATAGAPDADAGPWALSPTDRQRYRALGFVFDSDDNDTPEAPHANHHHGDY